MYNSNHTQTWNMALEYSKYVLDELYISRKEGDSCNLKLICEKRELWAHCFLLRTVSLFVREIASSIVLDTAGPLEITVPHAENFSCYDCVSKLLDALYARNVQEVEQGHEAHAENLLHFFKFVDQVQEFVYDSIVTRIPKDKRKYLQVNNTHTRTDVSKNVMKKPFKLRTPSKAISSKMQVCIECSFQCYKPTDLLTHILTTKHGKNVCSLCLCRTESARQFTEHLQKHDNKKPFFCTTCEQRFATRALLTQHLPTHSSLAPFRCPHCPKAFKWKHGLNGHLITHTKEKKHLCDECGFSTTHAKTLRAHKLTHSGDVFRCSYVGCSHTSSRKENMKIHLRTHSNEKPFVCEICGLNFTQSKNLHRHSLIHSQSKSNKIYSCLHCSFKALRSDNLKAHMQRQHTEKPLKLELCDNFVDTLSIPEEQVEVLVEEQPNDLTVLADAASSCSRISDVTADRTEGELVMLRNFDNLIANPTVGGDDNKTSELALKKTNTSKMKNPDGCHILLVFEKME